jgi:HEAT repeat protein
VRLNAIRALGQIGDPAAIPDVARCAQDPAWEVRNTVMRSLGKLHATDHVSELSEALRDESWWVRFSAAEALWQLGQPGREALSTTHKLSSDRFARDISRQILEEHSALNAPTLQTT